MTTYQLTHEVYVIKDGDTKVPTAKDTGIEVHPETLAYEAWLEAGGVPLPPEPAPLVALKLSSLAFLDIFTEAEQIAVAGAAMSNVQAKLWYDRTLAAEYIDISDPRTKGGLEALVSMGLISKERKDQIESQMYG